MQLWHVEEALGPPGLCSEFELKETLSQRPTNPKIKTSKNKAGHRVPSTRRQPPLNIPPVITWESVLVEGPSEI